MAEVYRCSVCRLDLWTATRPTDLVLIMSVIDQHMKRKHKLRWAWARLNRRSFSYIRVFQANP